MKRRLLAVAATLSVGLTLQAAGQQRATAVPQASRPAEVIAAWGSQRFVEEQFGERRQITRLRSGGDVVRIGSDYTLPSSDRAADVVVIAGTGTIEGETHDVAVIFGTAQIASTADIHGSLVLIGSETTIAEGAHVGGDLVVVGGHLKAPPAFAADGSHVVIDNSTLGGRFEGVFAWITHGLLWGRPIVPSLGWIWAAVLVFFFVYLLTNLVFDEPVGAVTGVLLTRPFSSFAVGLLMMILLGPICVLLAISVVGIAVVPLVLCAVLVAWVIGKVAGARWIGTSLLPELPRERIRASAAFVLGFGLITLAYMVPVLGLITWTMMGVFGLGASALAFVAAYRRENPRPVPAKPPNPPESPRGERQAEEPIVAPPSVVADLNPPLSATAPTMLTAVEVLPHASFRDRVAAAILDLILVIFGARLLDGWIARGDLRGFLLMLLAYHIGFWTWKGTTVGGIICQLRLIRMDGTPLRFADALVRGLAAIFSVIVVGLGELWILRDPERQSWHDRIAGTYVVKVPRNWPL